MDLSSFALYLKRDRKCLHSTVKRHLWNIKHILDECGVFDLEHVDAYLNQLSDEGSKGSYLNSLVDAVRVYAQFIHCDELVACKYFSESDAEEKALMSDEEIDAFLDLPYPKCRRTKKDGTTSYEFTKAADVETYEKWTMFFRILAYTGARPCEVARIDKSDILWGQQCIRLFGKNKKYRLAPIADNISAYLKTYLDALEGQYLFKANNSTGFFNSTQWGYQFHKRIKRMGIVRDNLTPYSLRHSFITIMLNEEVNLYKVQKIVGHSRISTTANYYHLVTKDIVTSINKHPGVQKKLNPTFKGQTLIDYVNSLNLDKYPIFSNQLDPEEGIRMLRDILIALRADRYYKLDVASDQLSVRIRPPPQSEGTQISASTH